MCSDFCPSSASEITTAKKGVFCTGSNMYLGEKRLAPSPHFILKYLINIPPKYYDTCANPAKALVDIHRSHTGTTFVITVINPFVGCDVYKISLQIETLCSGLPFAHTNEAWEEAGGCQQQLLSFPTFPTESLRSLRSAGQRGRQWSLTMHFLFAL